MLPRDFGIHPPLMRGCPPLSSSGSSQVSPNPPSESWVPTLARPWNQETSANLIATDIHMCALHTSHCAHTEVFSLTHTHAFTQCSSKLAFLLVQFKRKYMWAIFPERVHHWRNILSCTPKTCVVYCCKFHWKVQNGGQGLYAFERKSTLKFLMQYQLKLDFSPGCPSPNLYCPQHCTMKDFKRVLGPTLSQFFLRLPCY